MNKMTQDMHSIKMTEEPDHDFAMMMRSHYQGAILPECSQAGFQKK